MKGIASIIVLRSLALGAILLVASPACPARQDPRYDGHWWLLLTSEEQSGYINGDADCYQFELNKAFANPKPGGETEEFVTNFYRNNPDRRSLSVYEVLRIVDRQPPLTKRAEGGEVWNERHGYWDGQWWREARPAGRLGFVEGYLACHRAGLKNSGAHFSKAPPSYVALINRWYGLNEETLDVDPKRVDVKVADVLFKVRNQSSRSPR